eukprot:600111-Pelagomonas_calceolata.AAC.2
MHIPCCVYKGRSTAVKANDAASKGRKAYHAASKDRKAYHAACKGPSTAVQAYLAACKGRRAYHAAKVAPQLCKHSLLFLHTTNHAMLLHARTSTVLHLAAELTT